MLALILLREKPVALHYALDETVRAKAAVLIQAKNRLLGLYLDIDSLHPFALSPGAARWTSLRLPFRGKDRRGHAFCLTGGPVCARLIQLILTYTRLFIVIFEHFETRLVVLRPLAARAWLILLSAKILGVATYVPPAGALLPVSLHYRLARPSGATLLVRGAQRLSWPGRASPKQAS